MFGGGGGVSVDVGSETTCLGFARHAGNYIQLNNGKGNREQQAAGSTRRAAGGRWHEAALPQLGVYYNDRARKFFGGKAKETDKREDTEPRS